MSDLKIRFNRFGFLGFLFYFFISMPFVRSSLFGEKDKILDIYSGEIVQRDDVIQAVGQVVLFVPYVINEYVFSKFEFSNFNLLVFLIMSPIVYRYFSYSKGLVSFFVLLFLFFPAPLLFLSNYNKEIILVVCLFLSYGYRQDLSTKFYFIYFFLYSLFLRPYLVWVPIVMKVKLLRYSTAFVFVVFVVFLQFSASREIIYRLFNRRMMESGYQPNSEIIQTVYVKEFFDIFLVFFEVFPQIFFPAFIEFSIKNLIFQIYLWLLVFLCVVKRNAYANIFIFLLILYMILDPDLGAFFRHVSSFFILIPLMLDLHRRKSVAI